MTAYVALLRAVNVGGTGRIPMKELVRMCGAAGLDDARTVGASGNVVFTSALPATAVRAALEGALSAFFGKPASVQTRTAGELAAVLASNPFSGREPAKRLVIFLDESPDDDALACASGRKNEETVAGDRVVYVHYPDGQGKSKLKMPGTEHGTARNVATLAKLAALASES